MSLLKFSNSQSAAPTLFCHRHEFTRQPLVLLGAQGNPMKALLDISAWAEWMRSLDAAWLFVPIMAFVIVVVRLWSRGLRSDKPKESKYDRSGS